ncbi:Oxidoreductase htatip2, partial [Coelomomyces lativittatus]
EQFWKIDHDYVINTAKFIQEVNQPTLHTSHLHFLYCSAQGANLESKFLYPKCKGTIEKELSELGFPYVSIVRPGLIEIDKTRAHGARWMESLALHLLPLFKWMAPQSISCPASTIAKAMVQLAIHPPPTSSTATTTTTSNSMTMNAATTQTTTSSIFTIFDNRKIYELANEMK